MPEFAMGSIRFSGSVGAVGVGKPLPLRGTRRNRIEYRAVQQTERKTDGVTSISTERRGRFSPPGLRRDDDQ